MRLFAVFLPLLAFLAALPIVQGQELPKLKFTEVAEIAPGVFFRYSAKSATDPSVVFGGCNNIWIVFEDYVLAYDANFPKEAGDVIAAIRKTTNKPIRYVVNSHHHKDHVFGNAVFARAGATVVAQTNCARILRLNGPKQFADAAKDRPDIAKSHLRVPDLIFDEKLVFSDNRQHAELLHFGRGHTLGDTFLYLPRHKILCTGDACVNGPFSYLADADSASWARVLEKVQQLDVAIVCPGHGPLAGKEVLESNRRYLADLRTQVKKGIDAGREFEDILKNIDMPWYKEWTGLEAATRSADARHVFDEMTGRLPPLDLLEDFGLREGPSPTKSDKGWTPPRKIVVPDLARAQLLELKRIAPEVYFIPVKSVSDAAREAAGAEAVVGYCSAEIARAKSVRWIQIGQAGVEDDLTPELVGSNICVTNLQRLHGPNVADTAFALLLAQTRGLARQMRGKANSDLWTNFGSAAKAQELHDKTMLIVGLGGIGTHIARRAEAFGMRVLAIDPDEKIVKPAFVFSIEPPAKLMERIPQADVIVLACPLTKQTRGMFGAGQFAAMKKTAYFINIARGGLVDQEAMIAALKKNGIAGAGLDVTDPEPLPANSPLWRMSNVVIGPHVGGPSDGAADRHWRLFRENIRRFVAGEPLLCVVDKQTGY